MGKRQKRRRKAAGLKGVNRNYKDTVFRMLFADAERLLSLYNSLNGTGYTDSAQLRFNTLENAIYMNMKNDLSFVIANELQLYEHQSTLTPNLPLRSFFMWRMCCRSM